MNLLKSPNNQHVFWAPQGALVQDQTLHQGWFFWDEVGLLGGGPYVSEAAAIKALQAYAVQLHCNDRPNLLGKTMKFKALSSGKSAAAKRNGETCVVQSRNIRHKKDEPEYTMYWVKFTSDNHRMEVFPDELIEEEAECPDEKD